jgi:hypothetical protein
MKHFCPCRLVWLPAGVVLAVALAGCKREDEPRRFQVPVEKTETPAHGFGAEGMPPHGMGAEGMPTHGMDSKVSMFPPTEEPGLACDTPKGWVRGRTGGMRKAAFVVQDGDRKVEITAIDLPLGAGAASGAGAPLPNVNRWRGQIKLPEITQAELDKSLRPIRVADVDGSYVELLGPESEVPRQAILGVLAIRGEKAWFFKLWGDADLALREKSHFEEFVKSVRFDTPASQGAPPAAVGADSGGPDKRGDSVAPKSAEGSSGAPKSAKGSSSAPKSAESSTAPAEYDVPKGWTSSEVAGVLRAAFEVTDGERKGEVTVMELPGRVQPLLPNVNRWRRQVKLAEITQADLEKALQPRPAGGVDGQYLELVGPEGAKPREAMLVVLAFKNGKSWLFRLKGDADLALREKERFLGFVKSFKLSSADQEKNGK